MSGESQEQNRTKSVEKSHNANGFPEVAGKISATPGDKNSEVRKDNQPKVFIYEYSGYPDTDWQSTLGPNVYRRFSVKIIKLPVPHQQPPKEESPDVIILNIPNEQLLEGDILAPTLSEYWQTWTSDEDKPEIIVYTDGFQSSTAQKSDRPGCFWASTPDQLKKTLLLSSAIEDSKETHKFFDQGKLALQQQEQYDASVDLRDWERVTADTYQSLRLLLSTFNYQEANSPTSTTTVRTILDCGTGDGRIGGMLGRAGFNVLGLDISQEQLKRGRIRLEEEGEGLRSKKEDQGLSYPALLKLKAEGIIKGNIITDDKEARKHYLATTGNIFSIDFSLVSRLRQWELLFPNVNRLDFFPGLKEKNQAVPSFDAVLFNWHSFCEAGDARNQSEILNKLFDIITQGGVLVIEIPDRTTQPYAEALRKYHLHHPTQPYGTLQEAYHMDPTRLTQTTREFTPRYFPDRDELTISLQSKGFEIDPEKDIQTYLIKNRDPHTGKEKLEVKELFITARKPNR
ncbi:MAG: hypothetical protein Q7S03_04280 [bacterium]|nr:hypothetical protein [bacterium]